VKLSWRGLTRLFLISSLLEQVAWGHLAAFTPLVLQDLGLTPAEVGVWTGLLFTTTMVVALPLTPIWGVLAERYSRRLLILRSYVFEAAAYLLFAFAPDLSWLVVARLLVGLTFGSVATVMATQAYFTPRKHMGAAIATVQAAFPISASLSPPLGAALLPFIGLRGLFLLDAVLVFFAAVLIGVLMREPESPRTDQSVLSRIKEVLGWTMQVPTVRWNMIGSFAVRGATATVDTYLPLRITQLAGPNPANAIGLILGIYGLLTAISTWLVGKVLDRTDESRLFTRAMVAATVLTAALAVAPNIWLLGLISAVRSVPVAMSSTVLFIHLARVVPRERQTAVMGIGPLPRTAGALVFPVLAAAVAPLWAGAALAAGAISYGVAILAGQRMRVHTEALREESETAPEPPAAEPTSPRASA
jgi:MFS transporter, DHA1 family, multidrug resistance protein